MTTAREESERLFDSLEIDKVYNGSEFRDLRRSLFVQGAEWQAKQPIEITSEMVKKAAKAFQRSALERGHDLSVFHDDIRAALEAALGAVMNERKELIRDEQGDTITDGMINHLAQLLNPANTKIEVTGHGSPCDECDAPYSLWKGWDDDRGELDICFECHLDGHSITDEEKEEWRKEWAMERSDLVAKLIRYDTNKYWSLYGRYFLPKEEKE